jgi:hypothetical protein
MNLARETREFLGYLRNDHHIRPLIKADRNKTLLYAGSFFGPEFSELEKQKKQNPNLARLQTLGDVLDRLPSPGCADRTLKNYVERLLEQVPEWPDSFAIWSALSKIFASNAEGQVFFSVGSGIDKKRKVFATVEVEALRRNPRVDTTTREMVYYFHDKLKAGEENINFGFVPAPSDENCQQTEL